LAESWRRLGVETWHGIGTAVSYGRPYRAFRLLRVPMTVALPIVVATETLVS